MGGTGLVLTGASGVVHPCIVTRRDVIPTSLGSGAPRGSRFAQ